MSQLSDQELDLLKTCLFSYINGVDIKIKGVDAVRFNFWALLDKAARDIEVDTAVERIMGELEEIELNKADSICKGNIHAVLGWYAYTKSKAFSNRNRHFWLDHYKNAIFNLEKGIQCNNPDAMLFRALMHDSDINEQKDYQEIIRLYKEAIARGHPGAMLNLAFVYTDARYGQVDYPEAVRLLEQRIELGWKDNALSNLYSSLEKEFDKTTHVHAVLDSMWNPLLENKEFSKWSKEFLVKNAHLVADKVIKLIEVENICVLQEIIEKGAIAEVLNASAEAKKRVIDGLALFGLLGALYDVDHKNQQQYGYHRLFDVNLEKSILSYVTETNSPTI